MRLTTILTVIALAAGQAGAQTAAGSLVTNGSFEAGDFRPDGSAVMSLQAGELAITGWTVEGDRTSWIGPDGPWNLSASEGKRFLDLTDYSYGPPFGGVWQQVPTEPGTTYDVTFDLGSSSDYGAFSAITVSAAGQSRTFYSGNPGTADLWQTVTFTFIAAETPAVLSFTGAEGANYIGLDNVRMGAHQPDIISRACSCACPVAYCTTAPMVY